MMVPDYFSRRKARLQRVLVNPKKPKYFEVGIHEMPMPCSVSFGYPSTPESMESFVNEILKMDFSNHSILKDYHVVTITFERNDAQQQEN